MANSGRTFRVLSVVLLLPGLCSCSQLAQRDSGTTPRRLPARRLETRQNLLVPCFPKTRLGSVHYESLLIMSSQYCIKFDSNMCVKTLFLFFLTVWRFCSGRCSSVYDLLAEEVPSNAFLVNITSEKSSSSSWVLVHLLSQEKVWGNTVFLNSHWICNPQFILKPFASYSSMSDALVTYAKSSLTAVI